MKTLFRFFVLGLFLFVSGTAFPNTRPPAEMHGSFEIVIGGKKAGLNSYRLTPNQAGFSLESRTQIHSIFSLLFFEQTQLDARFSPISYHLTILLPYGAQEVVARCTKDSIFLKYRRSLKKPFHKVALRRKNPLFLLDNNLVNHWAILFHALSVPDSGSAQAFGLIPQVLKMVPLKIEAAGTDTLQIGEHTRRLRKLAVSFAGLSISALVDPSTRRLEKMVIPAQNFSMRRLLQFRDFSLAERDSLLRKFAGPAPEKQRQDFPSRDVTFRSDSLLLAGTLTLPKAAGSKRFPAVLFISGSGAVDRDENAQAIHINFFPQLSDTLTPNGWVTFRYDKRGVGKSQGDFAKTDLDDLLFDAGSALAFLRHQPNVDSTRIALVGHSEGAILALILTSQRRNVKAAVLMAGTARNLGDVVLDQLTYLQKLKGGSPKNIAETLKKQREFFRKVRAGKIRGMTPQGNADWWREHLAIEPLKLVCKVKVPLLIMNGAKDYQVSAEKDARPLFQKAKSCGVDATLKIYPNLDHLFEAVQGKSTPEDYFKPGRKIPPQVKADLLNWLKKKVR